ncbi:putative ammonium transporter 2 [Saccoglossus kowalevskii]|uniref:Ammonium transporter n=1 Tax=Saccoglossus kowalevskii TaxID=10224 RepID=A0ABM0MGW4_SACKO|nr:PREDICTED: putative ammonium transporter 3-like [Saccoglossus kowalevskii]
MTINASLNCDNTTILLYMLPNEWDDATWILSSAFVIFTMQSGFGLLESGTATLKNEVNIMVKNAVDVIYGGITYWMFGYAFSFGDSPGANAFSGFGDFFYQANDTEMGTRYSQFVFHASFATTATTIVSGAMVERTRLEAYIVFSFVNTLVFSFPSHWVWAERGFLYQLGVLDIAGAGPVHIAGGITGLVATIFLKPRHRRYSSKSPPPMGSPTNAILGMFMLWWGWLGFNCGSTNGITAEKWKLAARSAVSTICSSMAGGIVAITLSYVTKRRKFDVGYIINGVLGALVSITSSCAASHPWESFLIGAIGGIIACSGIELMNKLKIDDPVGVVPVHAMCGAWSLLAGGILGRQIKAGKGPDGLTTTGKFDLLGIQLLAILTISAWCILVSSLLLTVINLTIGLRLSLDQEILGADLVEHSIGCIEYDKIKKCIVEEKDEIPDVTVGLDNDTTQRARRAWNNAFQKVTAVQRYAKTREKKSDRPEQILVNFLQRRRTAVKEDRQIRNKKNSNRNLSVHVNGSTSLTVSHDVNSTTENLRFRKNNGYLNNVGIDNLCFESNEIRKELIEDAGQCICECHRCDTASAATKGSYKTNNVNTTTMTSVSTQTNECDQISVDIYSESEMPGAATVNSGTETTCL